MTSFFTAADSLVQLKIKSLVLDVVHNIDVVNQVRRFKQGYRQRYDIFFSSCHAFPSVTSQANFKDIGVAVEETVEILRRKGKSNCAYE